MILSEFVKNLIIEKWSDYKEVKKEFKNNYGLWAYYERYKDKNEYWR